MKIIFMNATIQLLSERLGLEYIQSLQKDSEVKKGINTDYYLILTV